MKTLAKRVGAAHPEESRASIRSRFARWLSAPILAAGVALGGCIAQTAGIEKDASPHDVSVAAPVCETRTNQRQVNESTIQLQELEFCDGVLVKETSIFSPPLDDGLNRQNVWINDAQLCVLDALPDIVNMAYEKGRYQLVPGQSVWILHDQYVLRLDDIDEYGAHISISNGKEDVVSRQRLMKDYSWYQHYLGGEKSVMLDLYGFSIDPPSADISVFHGVSQPGGGVMGYTTLNEGSITALWDGFTLKTPDGEFKADAVWNYAGLTGWTLTRK